MVTVQTTSVILWLLDCIKEFVIQVLSVYGILPHTPTMLPGYSRPSLIHYAAFSAFTDGLSAKWNYISRTIPNIGHLLQPLEDTINHTFIPSITKRSPCSNLERNILALPPRLGGMGITNPAGMHNWNMSPLVRLQVL